MTESASDHASSGEHGAGGALRLTVLGCSGSYAAAGNACSGYLVRSGGASVWLDAGPGTLANLQQHCSLADLDAVVLTHEHPDHWLEIPVLTNALIWFEQRPRLRVVSPQATFDAARALIGDELDIAFDWQVVDDGESTEIGDQRWSFSLTDHYVPTLATLVESAGRSIVYSADTGPEWGGSTFAHASPIDIALVESSFSERAADDDVLHLTASEAADLAAALGARRLVLTHLTPGQDPAMHAELAVARFGSEVEVAEVGATYDAAS